jgi:DNA primase
VGTNAPAWLVKKLAFRQVAVAFDADTAGDAAAPRLIGQLRSFGAQVERWRPMGVKDWNDLLVLHGAEVLGRDLAEDVDDHAQHVEESAAADVVRDVGEDQHESIDGADHALAGSDPGSSTWIEVRDPTTGETFDVAAESCPPSWRRLAIRETYQRELWGHPP